MALAKLPMLVIVGLTGVGKTTTLEALQQLGHEFILLPDRREMTERFIIAYMQAADGLAVRKISRFERYPYIQRFREQFPGGMAYVLTTLALENTAEFEFPLFFNGLRGENEIRHAVEALPQARFIALTAPDVVRVQRLLKRNDPHDRIIEAAQSVVTGGLASFAALGVADATSMFTPAQEQDLLELARNGTVSQTELRDKLRIMVEEYHTYNQTATLAALQALAPHRTLVIDTTQSSPEQAAQAINTQFSYLFETKGDYR
jgi:hypothetical protein